MTVDYEGFNFEPQHLVPIIESLICPPLPTFHSDPPREVPAQPSTARPFPETSLFPRAEAGLCWSCRSNRMSRHQKATSSLLLLTFRLSPWPSHSAHGEVPSGLRGVTIRLNRNTSLGGSQAVVGQRVKPSRFLAVCEGKEKGKKRRKVGKERKRKERKG